MQKLQMQHAVLDLLRAALIPELGADIATGAAGNGLSPGGAISYVEVPNMQDNLEAVISVLQFIYDNIMYAELNTKSDYCQVCGYDGEIKIVEDDGKLVWECPKCGNRRSRTSAW